MDDLAWSAYPIPDNLPSPIVNDPSLALVSIVTPSYNQDRFIRETIESVLTQDYPNLEYWVIDGGSTDETIRILREYEHDPRFHWISEADKGQSDAINKGWSRCRGDILAWLCSDDVYCPGAVRTLVDYLRSNPDQGAAYGDLLYIDTEGQITGKFWAKSFSQIDLLSDNFIPQPSTLLRSDLVKRVGIVDPSLHYFMDGDYWLRSSAYTTFGRVHGEIAKYRFHKNAKTVSQTALFSPEIESATRHFLESADAPRLSENLRNTVYADLMLAISMNYARANESKKAIQYLRNSLRHKLFRPRLFWLLLTLAEAKTRLPIARILSQWWVAIRSKV